MSTEQKLNDAAGVPTIVVPVITDEEKPEKSGFFSIKKKEKKPKKNIKKEKKRKKAKGSSAKPNDKHASFCTV